jgi:hypothetical protein
MFNIYKITIISYRNIFLLSSLKIINALNIIHRTKKNYIGNMLHIIYKLKLEQFYHHIVLAFVNDLKHKKNKLRDCQSKMHYFEFVHHLLG